MCPCIYVVPVYELAINYVRATRQFTQKQEDNNYRYRITWHLYTKDFDMNWFQMHNNYVWIKHFTGHDIKQKFLAIHHINVLVI